MQHWPDNGASFGVSLIHQCVQVGQEGVTDVQDVPGCIGEGGVPRHGILSLMEKKNVKVVIKDGLTTMKRSEELGWMCLERGFWLFVVGNSLLTLLLMIDRLLSSTPLVTVATAFYSGA